MSKKATKKEAPKRKAGRPATYSTDLMDAICERLSKGEPLAAICRDENMPSRDVVYDWINADTAIEQRFARARENGEEAIAADCLNIADDNGKDTRFTEEGIEITNPDVVQRAKLRIDTRLKLLAKWNPKKYGEKLDVTSGDKPIPAPIIQVLPQSG